MANTSNNAEHNGSVAFSVPPYWRVFFELKGQLSPLTQEVVQRSLQEDTAVAQNAVVSGEGEHSVLSFDVLEKRRVSRADPITPKPATPDDLERVAKQSADVVRERLHQFLLPDVLAVTATIMPVQQEHDITEQILPLLIDSPEPPTPPEEAPQQ